MEKVLTLEEQEKLRNLSTEELIKFEDVLDWRDLSIVRTFSFVEIRLFRKKIDWTHYIVRNDMSEENMELASKYFTSQTYYYIARLNKATKSFILNHIENFKDSWKQLFLSSSVNDDIVFALEPYWHNEFEVAKNSLQNSKVNDLTSEDLSGSFLLFNI